MARFLLTDIDGPVQDGLAAARRFGVDKIYAECKKDAYLLEEKMKGYEGSLDKLKISLAENPTIKPGVYSALSKIRDRGVHIYGFTDNVTYDNDKTVGIFMRKFTKKGDGLFEGLFCAKRLEVVGGDIKVVEVGGGKKAFAEDLCRGYVNGTIALDDENDIGTAVRIRSLKKELGNGLKTVQVGENCKKLRPFVDYWVEKFPQIAKYV